MKSSEFYKTTAWKWFSRYVLLYHSKIGLVKCATSGKPMMINDKNCHAGHLIKVFESGGRTNFNTAFDFRNVLPQSHRENVYMGGNELRMMEAVEEIHGEGTYKDLRLKSKIPFKLDKVTLKMISDEYREKYNALAKVKGKYW